jgi:SAM-dependent methyltransferase
MDLRDERELHDLRVAWNTFGEKDPLWAVLTDRERRGGKWPAEEFFATGRQEIDGVLRLADSLGLPAARNDALDFGCGAGRLTQALADHFASVVGVDIAPSMLAAAERHNTHANCRFALNERPDLSLFADASFDVVYTTIVLQHMPPGLALGYVAEFARVLREGGLAVFTLPSGPSSTAIGRLYRVIPPAVAGAYKKLLWGANMQMHGVPMETLVPRLTELGLRIERVQPDTSPGPNWRGFRYVVSKPQR